MLHKNSKIKVLAKFTKQKYNELTDHKYQLHFYMFSNRHCTTSVTLHIHKTYAYLLVDV